ncbi:MAG: hypothetical protein K0S56_2313 [Microvirga sp.]|nr:hypothetical protein [Microvirga sp.]
MIHMMRKQQAEYARPPEPTLAEQFEMLFASATSISPCLRLKFATEPAKSPRRRRAAVVLRGFVDDITSTLAQPISVCFQASFRMRRKTSV